MEFKNKGKAKSKKKLKKYIYRLSAIVKKKLDKGSSPLEVHRKVEKIISKRVIKVFKKKGLSKEAAKDRIKVLMAKVMGISEMQTKPSEIKNFSGAEAKSWVMENKWLVIGAVSIIYLWKVGQLKKFI